MKIKELENKIILAELNPKASYIMLYDRTQIPFEIIKNLQVSSNIFIYIIPTDDINKSIKFVEIPKGKK